jgi:hypothetical protein
MPKITIPGIVKRTVSDESGSHPVNAQGRLVLEDGFARVEVTGSDGGVVVVADDEVEFFLG